MAMNHNALIQYHWVSWFQVHLNTYLRGLVLHISFRNHIEHCSPVWNKSSGLFNLKFLHFVCYCLSFITVFGMSWTIFPNSLFIYWQLPKASTVQSFLLRHCFFHSSHLSGANALIFQALETRLKRKRGALNMQNICVCPVKDIVQQTNISLIHS